MSRLPVEGVPCDRVPELLRRARAALPGPGASKLRRAVALSQLSHALLAMYRCAGDQRHVAEAVSTARDAVALVPEGRPERRTLVGDIAGCLSYIRTVEAQEEAVVLWQGMLDGLRDGSSAHAETLGRTGLAFLTLHELRSRPEDLEHAVDRLGRALAGPRLEDVVRAPLAMGMACALMERSRRVSADPEDARRAVDLLESLERTGAGDAVVGFGSTLRVNLESARQELIRVSGDLDVLPAAGPRVLRLLAGLTFAGHPEYLSATRSALSAAVTGRLSEADRAVRLVDRALDGVAPDDPSRSPLLCDAAHSRLTRARWHHRADPGRAGQDVEDALRLAREAVRLAVGLHVSGAQVMLAECLLYRYVETSRGRPPDVDEAARLLERVLRSPHRRPDLLAPARDRYADVLLLRAIRDGRAEDFEAALELRTTAVERLPRGTPRRAHADAAVAQTLLLRAAATGLSDHWAEATSRSRRAVRALEQVMPATALDTARRWAHWSWENRRLRDASEAYDRTLGLLYRVTVTQVTRNDKETVLAEASTAGQRTAYAHTVAGDLRGAALSVETVRAVILAEALDREGFALDSLRAVRPELAARYERAALRLDRATDAYAPDTT